jgi:hypothetical protein
VEFKNVEAWSRKRDRSGPRLAIDLPSKVRTGALSCPLSVGSWQLKLNLRSRAVAIDSLDSPLSAPPLSQLNGDSTSTVSQSYCQDCLFTFMPSNTFATPNLPYPALNASLHSRIPLYINTIIATTGRAYRNTR